MDDARRQRQKTAFCAELPTSGWKTFKSAYTLKTAGQGDPAPKQQQHAALPTTLAVRAPVALCDSGLAGNCWFGLSEEEHVALEQRRTVLWPPPHGTDMDVDAERAALGPAHAAKPPTSSPAGTFSQVQQAQTVAVGAKGDAQTSPRPTLLVPRTPGTPMQTAPGRAAQSPVGVVSPSASGGRPSSSYMRRAAAAAAYSAVAVEPEGPSDAARRSTGEQASSTGNTPSPRVVAVTRPSSSYLRRVAAALQYAGGGGSAAARAERAGGGGAGGGDAAAAGRCAPPTTLGSGPGRPPTTAQASSSAAKPPAPAPTPTLPPTPKPQRVGFVRGFLNRVGLISNRIVPT
ncbi:hypothetical protein FOA52_009334 [Chlamydomonas sp. UWO 241]|nr:hypothetical protein FOA52_009334 [Chlamydomonas sp. UWO 241]